jgi:predicted RNase H-like nuclease (RuvC/YqgF family)
MTNDPDAAALHQRLINGDPLTVEERKTLQAWYAKNAEQEVADFAQATRERLSDLQREMNEASATLAEEVKRVQDLKAENARLQDEIARLESKLAQNQPR